MDNVLVLNASYEPLNVCSTRRAHVLVWKGKAEVVERLDEPLRTSTNTYVRPHVIRLVTHRNRCRRCGRRVASTHPLQVSPAGGAAGTHLGPRALALAASLNKGLGLTMRKTCAVLRDLLGIDLSVSVVARYPDRA